jgi:hypothetical protein
MSDWLQIFAVARSGRPLFLFLALWLALWIAAKALHLKSAATLAAPAARKLLVIPAFVSLVAFAGIAVWYAADERFYDFAEPTMPAVAWMFELGKPLYPPPDAADRYAHIYGPMAFIPHAVALRLFGGGLWVTKSVGAGAGLLSLVMIFLTVRSARNRWYAVTLTGYCALQWLIFRNVAFWNRPDSLELLCVSIGMWGVLRAPSRVAWLVLGVTAGVLWNLKFSGPLYSLPLFVLLWERSGPRRLLLAGATAILVAVFPFVALPNVSRHDYLTWIRLSGGNGIVWSTLRQNMEWCLYLLIPLALSLQRRRGPDAAGRPSGRVAASLLLAMCGVAILASKPGAGPYHLLPFIPITCVLAVFDGRSSAGDDFDRLRVRPLVAFVSVAVLIALAQQTSFIATVTQIDLVEPIADVTRFTDQHPGRTVQIGYASDERMTFIRPLLVYRFGSYLLDQPAIQEHQLSGVAIPAATRQELRSCAVAFWLVPKGGTPFSAVNRYPQMAGRALFDDEFRRAFFESYRPAGATRFFDVWACAP